MGDVLEQFGELDAAAIRRRAMLRITSELSCDGTESRQQLSAEPRRIGQYREHSQRLSNGSMFTRLEPYPSVQLELSLSKSEQRLVQMLKKGFTNEEIAQAFQVSESTVKYHLRSLFGALDCDSRTSLVRSIS